MKRLFTLLMLSVLALSTFSQKAVNADGTLKFRGNVAIMVEGCSFTFKGEKFVRQVDDEVTQSLETALRALSMQKFQDMCFAVVNRDDDAFSKVKQLIEENKLEDYLDGFSVQAKDQGADYLFLVEITNYSEDDVVGQIEVSTRLINIENNLGFHSLHIPEHTRSHSGGVFTSNKGLKQPRFYPFHPQKRSKNGLYDRF